MQSSQTIEQLATALAQAQGEIKDAAKSSENPHFRSKYADLAEVLQTARPVLSKHGLSILQGPQLPFDGNTLVVVTKLAHKSGEWVESYVPIPLTKKDAQEIGKAMTYARRFGAAAIIGLAQDDDDGNSLAAPKASAGKKATKQETVEIAGEEREKLKAGFAAAQTKEDITKLVPAFTRLSPADQTTLQPFALEARKRCGL